MAKSKRKLSDINNEYKKQKESYRQTIEFLNQRVRFWFDCYRSWLCSLLAIQSPWRCLNG